MPRAQRKQLKQRARWSVKQHYGVMLSVCLLAILLGTEFTGSLDFLKVQTPTDVKVEREVLEESEFGIEQNNVWKVVTEVLAGKLEQGTQDADRLTEENYRKTLANWRDFVVNYDYDKFWDENYWIQFHTAAS